MITVYVKVTFYYTDGIHQAGTICQVREEDFDARFMKKLESPYENIYSKSEVDTMLLAKQDTLIEGTGIDIDEENEISCTVEPSTVTVTQVQTTGTKIATIDVDGVDTDIYAPNSGGGASSLNDLSDVTASNPAIGDTITYDGHNWNSQKYSFTNLAEVNISSPANGQVLAYDGTAWKNANASGGGSATKFNVCSFSESRTLSFREIQTNSNYAFAVNYTQKTIDDIKTAFENGGAIIVDADSSEAAVTGVIVPSGAGSPYVTFIATCQNGDIKLFNFLYNWGTQFTCNVSRSLVS